MCMERGIPKCPLEGCMKKYICSFLTSWRRPLWFYCAMLFFLFIFFIWNGHCFPPVTDPWKSVSAGVERSHLQGNVCARARAHAAHSTCTGLRLEGPAKHWGPPLRRQQVQEAVRLNVTSIFFPALIIIIVIFNVTRMQSQRPYPLHRTEAAFVKMTNQKDVRQNDYIVVLFISIGRMPFLVPTLDNADPLFVLVITPGFYLHHIH